MQTTEQVHLQSKYFSGTFKVALLSAVLVSWVIIIAILEINHQTTSFDNASSDLEESASLILQDQNWETNHLNSFIFKWKLLDHDTQESIRSTSWYQHFQFLLPDIINYYRKPETNKDYKTSDYNLALTKLEKIINIQTSNFVHTLLPEKFATTAANIKTKTTLPSTTPEIILVSKPNDIAQVKDAKSDSTVTDKEAQRVLKYFVDAYKNGDLAKFDGIFSKTAQSNDQNNLKGIKSDYAALFSTTASRELITGDMRWIQSSKHVIGLGKLKATVTTKSGTKESENRSLQIIAERIDNKVLITYLFHSPILN